MTSKKPTCPSTDELYTREYYPALKKKEIHYHLSERFGLHRRHFPQTLSYVLLTSPREGVKALITVSKLQSRTPGPWRTWEGQNGGLLTLFS